MKYVENSLGVCSGQTDSARLVFFGCEVAVGGFESWGIVRMLFRIGGRGPVRMMLIICAAAVAYFLALPQNVTKRTSMAAMR